MDKIQNEIINASCPHFACSVCRTKTSYPHQSWCSNSHVIKPLCTDCRYYDTAHGKCRHPVLAKGGGAI